LSDSDESKPARKGKRNGRRAKKRKREVCDCKMTKSRALSSVEEVNEAAVTVAAIAGIAGKTRMARAPFVARKQTWPGWRMGKNLAFGGKRRSHKPRAHEGRKEFAKTHRRKWWRKRERGRRRGSG
jgi:hypothetical protein